MFHYLDNPNILKTTNGIESYFGHLKNHLDLHRGLTKKTESTSLNGISISEISLKDEFFLGHTGNLIIKK